MIIQAKRKSSRILKKFIGEIKSLTVGLQWKVSSEEVLNHFGIKREEYYRYLYSIKESDPEEFSEVNTAFLVDLLDACGISDVKKIFSENGYYFSEDMLIDYQELFQSVFMNRLQNHKVDRDLLEISLSGCTEFYDGVSFYLDSVVSVEDITDFAIRLYLDRFSSEYNSVSRGILQRYTKKLLKTGILNLNDLTSGLRFRLSEKAVLWNFIDVGEIPDSSLPEQIRKALILLEFSGKGLPDEKALKKRYHELVKKYHPDINPDGLEKTRSINAAYTVILNQQIAGKAV